MELLEKAKAAQDSSVELPSAEELAMRYNIPFDVKKIVPDYTDPKNLFKNIPPDVTTKDISKILPPDPQGVQGPEMSVPKAVDGVAGGVAKSFAKTGENVANAPANMWNMLMEVAAYNEQMIAGTGGNPQDFYRSKKLPTLDFNVPAPTTDEKDAYALTNFVTNLSALAGSYGLVGGNMLAGSALAGTTNALLTDPNDPKFTPMALGYLSEHFKNSSLLGPIADAVGSLANKSGQVLDNPENNPDVKRLFSIVDFAAQDLALGAAVTTGFKALGAGFSHAEKALPLLRNERGSIGKPPEIPGASSVDGVPQVPNVGENVPNTGEVPKQLELKPVDTNVDIPTGTPTQAKMPKGWKNPLDGETPETLLSKINEVDVTKLNQEGLPNANPPLFQEQGAAPASVMGAAQGDQAAVNRALTRPYNDLADVLQEGYSLFRDRTKMQEILNKKGSGFTAGETAALGYEVNHSMNRLGALATAKEVTPQELAEFNNLLPHSFAVNDVYEGALTNHSYGLMSKNYVFDKVVDPALSETYLTLAGGKAPIEEVRRSLGNAIEAAGGDMQGSLKAVGKEMKRGMPWVDAINETISHNLTSNPLLAGEALVSGVARLEWRMRRRYALAVGVEKEAAKAALDALPTITGYLGEVASGLKSYWNGLHYWSAGQYNANLPVPYKFSPPLHPQPAMSWRYLENNGAAGFNNPVTKPVLGMLSNGYGQMSRMMSPFLPGVDRTLDAITHTSEIQYQAIMAAAKHNIPEGERAAFIQRFTTERPVKPTMPDTTGMSPVQLEAAQNKFIQDQRYYEQAKDGWDAVDKTKADIKLMRDPRQRVFLEGGNPQGEMSWGGSLYEMIQKVPMSRALDRFIRPMIQAGQNTLDMMPIVNQMSIRNKAIMQAGGAEAAMLKERIKMGYAILGTGALIGFMQDPNDPVISGTLPVEGEKRAEWKALGVKANSIFGLPTRMFNESGSLISMGVALGQLGKYVDTGLVSKKWEADYENLVYQMTAEVADKTLPDSAVVKMLSTLSAYDNKEIKGAGDVLGNAGKGLTSSLTPGAQFNRLLRDVIDPVKRERVVAKGITADSLGGFVNPTLVEGVLNLMDTLPGVSTVRAPMRDVLGYEIKHSRFRTPFEMDPDVMEKNKTLIKLSELGMGPSSIISFKPETPEDTALKLTPFPWEIQVPGTSVKINLDEKERDALILESLRKDKMSKDNGYQSFEDKINPILYSNEKSNFVKKYEIKAIFDSMRKSAIAKYLNNNKERIRKSALASSERLRGLIRETPYTEQDVQLGGE